MEVSMEPARPWPSTRIYSEGSRDYTHITIKSGEIPKGFTSS